MRPLVALLLLTFSTTVLAIDEGIDFFRLAEPQPTAVANDRIEVVDVFWYGCPACDAFKPFFDRWLANKPEDVEVIRLPAVFNETWRLHARAHYTAEALGIVDRFHPAMFDAIHRERRNLNTEGAIERLFEELGVERDAFRAAFNSFAVTTRTRRAEGQVNRYGVDGVPTVIVDGRFRASGSSAGGVNRLTEVLDHMIEQARQERAAQAE